VPIARGAVGVNASPTDSESANPGGFGLHRFLGLEVRLAGSVMPSWDKFADKFRPTAPAVRGGA